MQANQMFSRMLLAAGERLQGRDAFEIASNAGIEYDADAACLRLASLGESFSISWPELGISPEPEGWHLLLMLHYLDLADGAPLAGRLVSFAQLRNGMVRGGGFDRSCELRLQELAMQFNEEELRQRCLAMGGRLVDSNADFSAVLPFLPNYPVTLKLWFADEDFPASGRMLLDAGADHYLTIEDAVTVGEIILERLLKPLQRRDEHVQP